MFKDRGNIGVVRVQYQGKTFSLLLNLEHFHSILPLLVVSKEKHQEYLVADRLLGLCLNIAT